MEFLNNKKEVSQLNKNASDAFKASLVSASHFLFHREPNRNKRNQLFHLRRLYKNQGKSKVPSSKQKRKNASLNMSLTSSGYTLFKIQPAQLSFEEEVAYKNNENAAENSATDSSDETDNEKKKNEDVVDADFEEIKPEDDKKNAS